MILPTFGASLCDAICDKIMLLLAISASFSILFGMIYSPRTGWWPGVSIFIAMFILITITAIADFDKDRRFVELRIEANETSIVVIRGRAGEMQTVKQWELVVGDLAKFGPGDLIPCDCLILNSTGLTIDESNSINAHTVPIKKSSETDPFLVSNSYVLSGTCMAVVAAVGVNSTAK